MQSTREQLKRWEKAFEVQHQRKPRPEDIRKEPEIASLYRKYREMKKQEENLVIGPSPIKPKGLFVSHSVISPTKPPPRVPRLGDSVFGASLNKPNRDETREIGFFDEEIIEKRVSTILSRKKLKTESSTGPVSPKEDAAMDLTFKDPLPVEDDMNTFVAPSLNLKQRKRPFGQSNSFSLSSAQLAEFLEPSDVQDVETKIKNNEQRDLIQKEIEKEAVIADETRKQAVKATKESEEKRKSKAKEGRPPQKSSTTSKSSTNNSKKAAGVSNNFVALRIQKKGKGKRGRFQVGSNRHSYAYSTSKKNNEAEIEMESELVGEMPLTSGRAGKRLDPLTLLDIFSNEGTDGCEDQIEVLFDQESVYLGVPKIEERLGMSCCSLTTLRALLSSGSVIQKYVSEDSKIDIFTSQALIFSLLNHYLAAKNSSHNPMLTLIITNSTSQGQLAMDKCPVSIRSSVLFHSKNDYFKDDLETYKRLENNELDVLVITPEKLTSNQFRTFIRQQQMPRVGLCIFDDAQCVSEFSSQFKSSSLVASSVVCEDIKPWRLLALTLPTSKKTVEHVNKTFDIEETLVVGAGDIGSMDLSIDVSLTVTDDEKNPQLLRVIQSEPFKSLSSVLIKVMYQSQAEGVASFLRINSVNAQSYHSGKPYKERQSVMQSFISGKTVVLVTTFCMNIEKENLGGIIHYCGSRGFEEYLAEIGKIGPGGAYHVIISKQDYLKQRRFIFSDGFEREAVHQLIRDLKKSKPIKLSHDSVFVLQSASELEKLHDLKTSAVSTAVEFLARSSGMKVIPNIFTKYRVTFTKSKVEALAGENNIVHAITTLGSSRGYSMYLASMNQIVEATKISPYDVVKELDKLSSAREIYFEGFDAAICLEMDPKFWSENDEIRLSEKVYESLIASETSKLAALNQFYTFFQTRYDEKMMQEGAESQIMKFLNDMISSDDNHDDTSPLFQQESPVERQQALIDITLFVQDFSDFKLTGRAIARIFHGISSPGFPASEWSNNHMWAKYSNIDFFQLMKWGNIALKKHENLKIQPPRTEEESD